MTRFEDTVNLFGVDSGTSSGMCVHCDVCGTVHLEDNMDPETGDIIDAGLEFVPTADFAGLNVCECCFEDIELAVLRRMPDILSWFKRLLQARGNYVKSNTKLLNELAEEIFTRQNEI